MNLNAKRVAAALLTLAAFTGVLLKDLPFTGSAEKGMGDQLLSDNSLGDIALSGTGSNTTVSPSFLPPVAATVPASTFNGETSGTPAIPGATSLPDKSGSGLQRELPNPVGASSRSSTAPLSGIEPFLPVGAQGAAGQTSGFGGRGGGGSSGGGGASGPGSGPGGSGNSGTPSTGQADNGGGSSSEIPIVNNPDVSQDNPPAGHETPQNPHANPPSDNIADNTGPAPGDDVDINLPAGNKSDPDAGLTPPWIDVSLQSSPDTLPPSDVPATPGNGDTHRVPDTGSSLVLLMIALTGIFALSRKVKVA